MRTLVLDPASVDMKALLERRRRLDLDRYDEVWEGVLHVVPAPAGEHADIAQQLAEILGGLARDAALFPAMSPFNLGEGISNFRVPDGGLHRARTRGVWFQTAALVVEIRSPGDESWEKLPFYADHRVDEVLIVDPEDHKVHWLALADGEYHPVQHSALIDLGPEALAQRIDWP